MRFEYTFKGEAHYEDGESNYATVNINCGPTWTEPAQAFVRFLRGAGFYLHKDAENRILEALDNDGELGD